MKSLIKNLRGGNRLQLLAVHLLFTFFCLLLSIFRMSYTGNVKHLYLVWNLVLAWVPYAISLIIPLYSVQMRKPLVYIPVLAAWLLFLPNAPYIFTDMFHLAPRPGIPVWYDLMLILFYAWTGAMLGFISLLEVHRWVSARWGKNIGWAFASIALVLCSFGIYLGRFGRWNSWNIATKPQYLLYDITDRVIHPFSHMRTVGVTVLFSIFLILAYVTLRILMAGDHKNYKA